eukprot:1833029-Prymnesium_polylepis.1
MWQRTLCTLLVMLVALRVAVVREGDRGVGVALHVGAGRADGRAVAARRSRGDALAASGRTVPPTICAPSTTVLCGSIGTMPSPEDGDNGAGCFAPTSRARYYHPNTDRPP